MLHLIFIETVVAEREREARETARRASLLRAPSAVAHAAPSAGIARAAAPGRAQRASSDEAQGHPTRHATGQARRLSRPTSG